MSDDWNVSGCLNDYPLDTDYIDVADSTRASVDKRDTPHGSDLAHTFNRDKNAMSGTDVDVLIDSDTNQDEMTKNGTRTVFSTSVDGGFYDRSVKRDGRVRNYLTWLRLLHNGYRSPNYTQNQYDGDKQRWVDTYTAAVDLRGDAKERVEQIVSELNMKYMAFYKTELVILAIIEIVALTYGRHIRGEDTFVALIEERDTTMDNYINCVDLVYRKADSLDADDSHV